MADLLPRFEDAETLRKTNPAAALELFRCLWEAQRQFRSAARYAYCLRKVGRADEAVALCHTALEKYPGNKYIQNELVWDLYETKIKPAKESNNLNAALNAANEIKKLEPDALARQKIGFAVMQIAKAHSKWKTVLEWSDYIDVAALDNKPRQLNGRTIMSEREIFYIAKSRALLETEGFPEARTAAHTGLQEFPSSLFLARTAALALAGDGQLEEAVGELKQLVLARHADWYVKVDLAELELKQGHAAEAYRLCCEAAQNRQDEEFKLSLFVTLGRAALEMGQRQVAAEHIALSKALRDENDWRIPADLTQLEHDVRAAMKDSNEEWPLLPDETGDLLKICQGRWREGASVGLIKKTGRVGRVDPTRPFSFIFPDDRSPKIYVLLRNIPRDLAIEGKRVEFVLKPSFDKKKGVESFEAMDIHAAGN